VIVVKVELWPGGDERRKRSLGTAYIINDGTGTSLRGNYHVMLSRMKDATVPWRIGRVVNWPRTGSPWDLLNRAISAAIRNRSDDHTLRRRMVLVARRAMNGQTEMFTMDVDDDISDREDEERGSA
jgi:hypothetical protein